MQNEAEVLLVAFLPTPGFQVGGKRTKTRQEVENTFFDHLFLIKNEYISQHSGLLKQPYAMPLKTNQVR